MNADELTAVYRNERRTALLSELPDAFYAKAKLLLHGLLEARNAERAKDPYSLMADGTAAAYSRAAGVYRDIVSIRADKVLWAASYATVMTDTPEPTGLDPRERDPYRVIRNDLLTYKKAAQ